MSVFIAATTQATTPASGSLTASATAKSTSPVVSMPNRTTNPPLSLGFFFSPAS
ncbi:MAG: hypothetical protein R3F43_07590 [bacterium]